MFALLGGPGVTVAGCQQPFIFSREGLYLLTPIPALRGRELSPVIGPVTAHSEAVQAGPGIGPDLHSGAGIRERPPKVREQGCGEERTGWRLVPVLIRPRREEEVGVGWKLGQPWLKPWDRLHHLWYGGLTPTVPSAADCGELTQLPQQGLLASLQEQGRAEVSINPLHSPQHLTLLYHLSRR